MDRKPPPSTSSNRMRMSSHSGFTIIECLVVIAILGLLMAMIMPLLQTTRETSRRVACRDHLRQLGVSLQQYHDSHMSFPAGVTAASGPVLLDPPEFHPGWITSLLPFLDQPILAQEFQPELAGDDPGNLRCRQLPIPTLLCPSNGSKDLDALTGFANSNYAGCHDSRATGVDTTNNGVLFLNRRLTRDDLSDGVSMTLLVGEVLPALGSLGWASGSQATLRNTGLSLYESRDVPPDPVASFPIDQNVPLEFQQYRNPSYSAPSTTAPSWYEPPDRSEEPPRPAVPPVVPLPNRFAVDPGGFASNHPGGVQFLLADGLGRHFSLRMDGRTLQRLADRADGLPQSGNDF